MSKTIAELLARAHEQLIEVRTAANSNHRAFQSQIQELFKTVNRLTAFGHEAACGQHMETFDPTCDLCR